MNLDVTNFIATIVFRQLYYNDVNADPDRTDPYTLEECTTAYRERLRYLEKEDFMIESQFIQMVAVEAEINWNDVCVLVNKIFENQWKY